MNIQKMATVGAIFFLIANLAQAADAQSVSVSESFQNNYSIVCKKNGAITLNISENRTDAGQYHFARNITIAPLGGGRVVYSFLHGFTVADIQGTYMPASDEACEVFRQ